MENNLNFLFLWITAMTRTSYVICGGQCKWKYGPHVKKVLMNFRVTWKSVELPTLFFKDFIYFSGREREWMNEWGEGQRENQTPCWDGSPTCGSIPGPQDYDLSWRQPLDWLSDPGTLSLWLLFLAQDPGFKPCVGLCMGHGAYLKKKSINDFKTVTAEHEANHEAF